MTNDNEQIGFEVVKHILRLKKRDLARVCNKIRNRDQNERNSGDIQMSPQLSIRNPDEDMNTQEPNGQKDSTQKQYNRSSGVNTTSSRD